MYPPDVDPQSGCRLPLPKREELGADAQLVYDRLADPGGASLRGLRGPGGILLHSPDLARYTRPLNHHLRHEAGLGGRVRELAILTTARALDSQFEWAAHEPEALKEGVPADVVDVIKHRKSTQGLDETYAAIIELGRQTFGDHKVTSECFARVKKLFVPTKLVELVMLMGNYAATAALLTAFDMQLPEGQKPLLPVP